MLCCARGRRAAGWVGWLCEVTGTRDSVGRLSCARIAGVLGSVTHNKRQCDASEKSTRRTSYTNLFWGTGIAVHSVSLLKSCEGSFSATLELHGASTSTTGRRPGHAAALTLFQAQTETPTWLFL